MTCSDYHPDRKRIRTGRERTLVVDGKTQTVYEVMERDGNSVRVFEMTEWGDEVAYTTHRSDVLTEKLVDIGAQPLCECDTCQRLREITRALDEECAERMLGHMRKEQGR